MWTDERINQIANVAANQSLTRVGVAVVMAGYMREMRDDYESTMRQNQQLAALVAKQQRRISTLEETVNQQHGQILERNSQILARFM